MNRSSGSGEIVPRVPKLDKPNQTVKIWHSSDLFSDLIIVYFIRIVEPSRFFLLQGIKMPLHLPPSDFFKDYDQHSLLIDALRSIAPPSRFVVIWYLLYNSMIWYKTENSVHWFTKINNSWLSNLYWIFIKVFLIIN